MYFERVLLVISMITTIFLGQILSEFPYVKISLLKGTEMNSKKKGKESKEKIENVGSVFSVDGIILPRPEERIEVAVNYTKHCF